LRSTKYLYGYKIQEDKIDWACSKQGSDEKSMEQKGIYERKEQASRPTYKWKGNTKMYLKGVRV
jgi:hypothetical protein